MTFLLQWPPQQLFLLPQTVIRSHLGSVENIPDEFHTVFHLVFHCHSKVCYLDNQPCVGGHLFPKACCPHSQPEPYFQYWLGPPISLGFCQNFSAIPLWHSNFAHSSHFESSYPLILRDMFLLSRADLLASIFVDVSKSLKNIALVY